MHLRHLAAPALVVAALALASPASAGEISGNGSFTPNHQIGHSHSICSFSGLEDGDGAGFPGPGGAPPQNWGHSKEAFGATPAERKASGSPVVVWPGVVHGAHGSAAAVR